ncbi:dynein light chain roadblock-type 1 isoform X1 [Gopherus flavomarginatus]|uniref:dynein light chain roadblock-type 1 isoform X1 n=1 Tax=Gopherus flavomarginatus TaxID=286002 RepID=UPI0021CBCF2D|nr:dynein light chain roadblock-type 1 isoform X1 [Gopherus flavomarginatus]
MVAARSNVGQGTYWPLLPAAPIGHWEPQSTEPAWQVNKPAQPARGFPHTSGGTSLGTAALTAWLQAEVEETLKRIQSQKGVQGIIVVNSEGIPIKSTVDNSTTVQYAGLMHSFIMKARSTVRDIDPQNDLTFLRIRSKKNEIMIAPDKDYFLIVIQNPTE